VQSLRPADLGCGPSTAAPHLQTSLGASRVSGSCFYCQARSMSSAMSPSSVSKSASICCQKARPSICHCSQEDRSDTASPLLSVADDDARLHWGVVEQVGPQADDGLDPILLNHLGAHRLFLVAEQHAMRPKNGATPFGCEAGQYVLLERVIGTALRRRAQGVA